MIRLADHNDGFCYLLIVVDVFSKHAFVIALKKKYSKSVIDAFDKIVTDEKRKSFKLQIDKGKEFVNRALCAKLEDWDIQFYVSQNEDIKASMVERFNRTLKTKMWKYFTYRNTYKKFVDILQDMVHSYNRTHQRTIGRAPPDVNANNSAEVFERMYGSQPQQPVEPKLKVEQKVRISKTRCTFNKGYLPNWTEEIFTADKVMGTNPPRYKIVDYGGEPVEGSFYNRELQRTAKTNEVSKIKKILRTRKCRGGKEYNVKWRSYPSKFNSWVNEADVTAVI